MGDTLQLPPGATLVDSANSGSSNLPPGASLVSGSVPKPVAQPKYNEDDFDDKGVSYFPGERRKTDPATGRVLRHGMPGSFEGHPENIGEYAVATGGRAAEGAVDISRGNFAMGTHKLIQAGGNAIAPMAPLMAAGAPLTALRALGGGVVGSKVAGAVANASGASDDQKALAEDAGNIVGGGAAATGALRAFLGSPTKALLSKAATAADGIVSDDVLGMVSPRALHGLRLLRAASKVANGTVESGLSSIATKHTEAIAGLESQLNEALSKANALPPEGPTAQFKDVPDLRVQPSQQAPQNLLEARKAAFMAAQRGAQGEFQVAPPEAPGPSAVIRNVQGQPVSGSPVAPQDMQPTVLRATGQPQSTGRVTPNMEIYNEPMLPPKPVKPPTLLEQLRQWDQIRQIHSQLEDQIGKGQDEIQQWMADHDQQAPGGAARTAKARFQAARAKAVSGSADEPRVPTSDSDMEELLMKSVQAAKAKKAMSAKAGD